MKKILLFLLLVILIVIAFYMYQSVCTQEDMLSNAEIYAEKGDYEKAIEFANKAIKFSKENYGAESKEYTFALTQTACFHYQFGNYEEAIRLGAEAMEIQKEVLGNKHPDYATSLNDLAVYNHKLGNYQEAIRLGTETLEIDKEVLGDKHPDYATSLGNLALYNHAFGNYEEAIRQGTKAMEIRKEVLGDKHPDYATSLSNLASCNSSLGNYQEAIRMGTEVVEIAKEVLGDKHPDYATSLGNLAYYYSALGNYQEAIRLATEVVEIDKEVLGDKHPDYATSLSNLASYNRDLGNYQEAIRLGTEAMEIDKEVLGNKHPDYATSLSNLANYYSNLGNNKEAIRLGTEVMEIRKEVLGDKHPDYAASLGNLAIYNRVLGNYEEAIRLATEAMEIDKEVLGNKHPNNAALLNILALLNHDLENYDEAIRLGTETLEIQKEILGDKHPYYATSLSNLALYNHALGNYEEAIRLGTEAVEIQKEVLGDKHPDNAWSLNALAIYYHYLGNTIKRDKYAKEMFDLGRELIIGNFASMTPSEMDIFLKAHESLVGEQPNASVSYDALLLSKGLLLTAEMGINELILESGDKTALEMLEHVKMNTLIMNRQQEKPISERYLDVDSLRTEIEKERKLLAMQSKEFGDLERFFNTSWRDVRDNLKAGEAAIEFGTLEQGELVPSGHCSRALILRHDSQEPIDIYLELDDSKEFLTNFLANLPVIQQHMQGISKVYFSPSGEMYSTPIENYIYDGRDYIRVSSTREVVMGNHEMPATDKPMKLYGGLKYDMNTDSLVKVNEAYKQIEHKPTGLHATRSNRDAIKRASFNYLEGTLEEVQAIERMAKSTKKQCEVLAGEKGTEESLRTLDGKRYGLLHFATHGFYWTEEEAEEKTSKKRLSFLRMGDDQSRRHEEDKAMTRSGLIFSGANLALKGVELPDGMEDGIATAQEISHLDLRGCDLVVLSACQTGLGEVSGEGVFGLQRGFKKAGVNSILMSLWEVDDEATQMLMTEFYKHYLQGESKLDALHQAQYYVKSHPGFEDPEYWAGFILLDGNN